VKVWTIVLASILSSASLAAETRDFTREQCRSSTSQETFPCPEYVNECSLAALNKIQYKAASQRAVLDESSLAVSEVDDRFYNPSKYVWFSAKATQEDGTVIEIEALTQKSYFPNRACF
jgi:hypothetical protein